MNKEFNYEKWCQKYHNEEIFDLKELLTKDEFKIIEKLGIYLKDKIYTGYEFEILSMELSNYYKDDNMTEEELETVKSLEHTGVSKEEYDKLLDKIMNINITVI